MPAEAGIAAFAQNRPAFPVGLAVEMMEAERGRHFEPAALDAMRSRFQHIDEVRRAYSGD